MADLVMPSELPPPTLAGYSDSRGPITSRVERDIGHDRVRRQFRSIYALEEVSWDLEDCEFEIFEHFFYDTLRAGTLRFDMQLSDFEDGLAWSTAQFKGMYTFSAIQPGNRWNVSATLMLYGKPVPVRTVGMLYLPMYQRHEARLWLSQPRRVYGRASTPMRARMRLAGKGLAYGRAQMSARATLRLQGKEPIYARATMQSRARLAIGRPIVQVFGQEAMVNDAAMFFAVVERDLFGRLSVTNSATAMFFQPVSELPGRAAMTNRAVMFFEELPDGGDDGEILPPTGGTINVSSELDPQSPTGGTINVNDPY